MKPLLMAGGALAALLALTAPSLLTQTPAVKPDPVFQAMKDEMDRARKLTISNLEAPYFIQYVIDEDDNFGVTANLGGLLSRRHDKFRSPEVRVRVGDYKFDNTNYVGSAFGFGSRYDLERFPLENAYPVLRRYLWLETDSAYKSAVEAISRKRAALRNLTQSEQLSDFSHAEPVRLVREFAKPAIDQDVWAQRVRSLSAIFAQYPGVKNSSVELESSVGGYYLVNSEGSEVREPENVTYLRVRAMSQAPDGMLVSGLTHGAQRSSAAHASCGNSDSYCLTCGTQTLKQTPAAPLSDLHVGGGAPPDLMNGSGTQ